MQGVFGISIPAFLPTLHHILENRDPHMVVINLCL